MRVLDEHRSAGALDLRQPTWNQLSDSWWEERRIGLLWRVAEVCDGVEGVPRGAGEGDYGARVGCIRDRLRPVTEMFERVMVWVAEWREVACLVDSNILGQADVQVRT